MAESLKTPMGLRKWQARSSDLGRGRTFVAIAKRIKQKGYQVFATSVIYLILKPICPFFVPVFLLAFLSSNYRISSSFALWV